MSVIIRKSILFFLFIVLVNPGFAWAVKSVSVQGLFKNKAVLLIDGKRQVVKVGHKTSQGVKLIAINGEEVVLEIQGKRRVQKLGGNVGFSTQYVKPKQLEVTVPQDNRGLYTTVGSINGFSVAMLVDTGANLVSMNAQHANRLGVDYITKGQPTMVATASGIVKAYRVKLNTVAVGEIELTNVDAVVMDGLHPMQILLGMSFLGNLEIQRNGNVMKIKKTY